MMESPEAALGRAIKQRQLELTQLLTAERRFGGGGVPGRAQLPTMRMPKRVRQTPGGPRSYVPLPRYG
jgi:hypothetical protein